MKYSSLINSPTLTTMEVMTSVRKEKAKKKQQKKKQDLVFPCRCQQTQPGGLEISLHNCCRPYADSPLGILIETIQLSHLWTVVFL